MGGPGSGMKALTAPRDYSADTLELALNVLAMEGGRAHRTSELLADQGVHIPEKTIANWRDRFADRYQEICTNIQDHRAERMAAQAEDVVLAAANLEALLLADLTNKRADLKGPEIAGALRNVTTTKTLNMEKVVNPLRNRPSTITEVRNADEILKALEAKMPKSVDTTAQDITQDEAHSSVSSSASVA